MQNNVWDWFSLANVNNHTPRVRRLLNDLPKKTVIWKFTCEFYDSKGLNVRAFISSLYSFNIPKFEGRIAKLFHINKYTDPYVQISLPHEQLRSYT